MTSMTPIILILACLTIGGHSIIDEALLNFMLDLNGEFDNKDQVEAGSTEHDLIEKRAIPFWLYSVSPMCLVLFEVSVNGNLSVLQIGKPSIDPYNPKIIIITMYNFTDNSRYKPGEINIEDLRHLNQSDLTSDPDCSLKFIQLDDGSYSGLWPECRVSINDKHPAYSLKFSCEAYTTTVPLFGTVRTTSVPYVFKLKGSRFPVPGIPKYYVSPCERRKNQLQQCLLRTPKPF